MWLGWDGPSCWPCSGRSEPGDRTHHYPNVFAVLEMRGRARRWELLVWRKKSFLGMSGPKSDTCLELYVLDFVFKICLC